ncbi:MAG: AAA family ATPase [Rhodoferax sp.]|nr:AAA family ATPase [Rhodoferax sp.]MDP3652435.1 AAA family ATPase [Rhodoferax sp.]
MSQTASLLKVLGIPQSDLCRVTGMSRSAISRLCAHGEWPVFGADQFMKKIDAYLQTRGLAEDQMQALRTALQEKVAKARSHRAKAYHEVPTSITETETETKDEPMLLQNQALTQEARQHFGLPRSPFVDDVQSPDDVFQTPSVRYVRAALMDCANNHGFLAVVGESGAGKTTLSEDLEERIKAGNRDILVIRPYVLAMESNDQKGKTLKSSHIAEAIAYALDPQLKVKSSPQARFQQVHDLLKASCRAGRRHLLVVEEAHCLPLATLKHLKRFLELKDGMKRLLGVGLIGQPELRDRLGSQNAEVREVMQRCEVVELQPLDNDLEAYLTHKFARFELKLADVFTPDAFDAIRARLIYTPRGGKPSDARSLCYPLVVNNLVCRAMNAASKAGWPQVDAQVVAGC